MSDRSIIEAITKMTGIHRITPMYYLNATVESVDLLSRTCICTAIDLKDAYTINGVRLMAVIDDGLLIEPSIGSTVKVIYSDAVEPFICQYSEIENITIIANSKIKFNDGSMGGMVQVTPLVAKINKLESDLNTLKTAFNSWVVIPSDGGAALKLSASVWAAQAISTTVVIDLENNTIQHGI